MKLSDQLNEILVELAYVKVETTLIVGAIVLLIIGLLTQRIGIIKGVFFLVTLVALILATGATKEGSLLQNSLFVNNETRAFGCLFLAVLLIVLLLPRKKHVHEFYFLILSICIGSLLLIKANSLLLTYLSIELVSLTSYILTGFSFSQKGNESAFKYLLFGAVSAAVMLFGVGLLYGTSGTLYLNEMVLTDALLMQVGLLFFLCGLFFKVSIFPFHIWTPATYQEAPIDAVMVISILPKIAGIVLLKRLFNGLHFPMDHWLIYVLFSVGMITILVGTLGALRQSNTRRMISFGAIAHSGFLLPLVYIQQSGEVLWWYSVVYALMNAAVFYLLNEYEKQSVLLNRDYTYNKHQHIMGAMFTLVLVSLIGLPPMAGFTAKFFLFSVMWNNYLSVGHLLLLTYLLIAVFATVGSLFFYLRIPYYIYLSKTSSNVRETSIEFRLSTKIVATIFGVTLLLLFFVPDLVMKMYQFFIS